MSNQIKPSGDLFKNSGEAVTTATNTTLDSCASSSLAGSAQNSARKKKKSSAAFRTISEVADDLGIQQHVLRFWETKFSQVKPLKRGGGRRYYRPEDISLLEAIHNLLYVEGYTIKGVQKLLRDVGKKQIVASFCNDTIKTNSEPLKKTQETQKTQQFNAQQREVLKSVLAELKELRGMIKPNN